MSLLLNLLDELERESYSPSYFGNNFGFGIYPHHIQERRRQEPSTNLIGYTLPLSILNRQLSRRNERQDGGQGQVSSIGKDGFQVCMDVAHFKPSELNVKVVDNHIIVEGKHEEREDDHGYISRHFVRRYSLPKDFDGDNVISTLSSDGVLTVSVPKPKLEQKSNERIIQIQQTGPAHLNVKQNSQETDEASNGVKGADGDKK